MKNGSGNNKDFTEKEIKSPYVMTVCSGKGGVGKSVLAANTAYSIAAKGKKVLLWDADMHFPNQHLLMGVDPPVRLNDVYLGNINVDQAFYRVNNNLTLLADMPAGGSINGYDDDIIIETYKSIFLENEFDFIIIDTPAADGNEVLECCSFSDQVSIVVTDEPTSLLDAYGLVKILLQYIDIEKLNLFVNNVIDWEDADDISSKLNKATENFLGTSLEVLGFIPYDRAVRQSIMRQELLLVANGDSEASVALDKIAEKIIDKSIKITELQ